MSQEDKKTVPEDFNPIIQSPRTGTKSDKSDCFKWRPRRQSRARLVWTRLMILTSLCLYISVLIWVSFICSIWGSVLYTRGGGIELSKGFEKWAASRSFPLSRELDVSLNKTRK